jgi:DNA gyrase subunit A
VVTLSTRGYIKRVPLEVYRAQGRGGRGKIGVAKREGDAVRHIMVADTHQSLLFFTDRGRVYQVKTFELPDESRQARGTPLINIIYLEQDERVTAVVATNGSDQEFLVLATEQGEVKKTALSEFAVVRRNGLITMDLEADDALVAAQLACSKDHAVLVTATGQALRFPVSQLRSASRQSGGVRGIRLAKGDRVVGMEIARPDQELLVVSSKGYGKRTTFEEYPTQGRGGQGVRTFTVNEKRGQLVTARTVNSEQELMLISEDGIVIRTTVDSIAIQGRATMGVTLMGVGARDTVASVASIDLGKQVEEKPETRDKKQTKAEEAPAAGEKAKPSAPARGKAAAEEKPTATGKTAAKPAAAGKGRASAKKGTARPPGPPRGRAKP